MAAPASASRSAARSRSSSAATSRVASVPGEGSTFTLYLPRSYVTPPKPARRTGVDEAQLRSELELATLERVAATRVEEPAAPQRDPRRPLGARARATAALLIVDNDEDFARYLLDVAREHGWQGIDRGHGRQRGGARARVPASTRSRSTSGCPDIDGLRVLRLLKADYQTRHIPVADHLDGRRRRERLPARRAWRAREADPDARAARRDARRTCVTTSINRCARSW